MLEALLYVALVGLIFAPLESIWGFGKKRTELRTDLCFATIGVLATELLLLFVVGGCLAWVHEHAPINIARLSADFGRGVNAARIIVALLIFELLGYAYHRAAHRLSFLWKLHSVHHSAQRMDWLASFRQHPLEVLLMTLVQNAPLALLGLPLGEHAIVVLLLKLNTVFVHADIDIPSGIWQHIVATPRFHHRHHASEPSKLANFSSLFPWIDHIFGTHSDQRSEHFGSATDRRGFLNLILLRT